MLLVVVFVVAFSGLLFLQSESMPIAEANHQCTLGNADFEVDFGPNRCPWWNSLPICPGASGTLVPAGSAPCRPASGFCEFESGMTNYNIVLSCPLYIHDRVLTVESVGRTNVTMTGAEGGTTNPNSYQITGLGVGDASVTAPLTSGGWNFDSWAGCSSLSGANNEICTRTMSADLTVTATYISGTPQYDLRVDSVGAVGVAIIASGGYGGSTGYTRSNIDQGTTITLTAPLTSGGNNFSNWGGCSSTAGASDSVCTTNILTDRNVTAYYIPPAPTSVSCTGKVRYLDVGSIRADSFSIFYRATGPAQVNPDETFNVSGAVWCNGDDASGGRSVRGRLYEMPSGPGQNTSAQIRNCPMGIRASVSDITITAPSIPGFYTHRCYALGDGSVNLDESSPQLAEWQNYTYEVVAAAAPECSDGVDNADPEDNLVDAEDPRCHTDGDSLNPVSYDPSIDTEINLSTNWSDDRCGGMRNIWNCSNGEYELWPPNCAADEMLQTRRSTQCAGTVTADQWRCVSDASCASPPLACYWRVVQTSPPGPTYDSPLGGSTLPVESVCDNTSRFCSGATEGAFYNCGFELDGTMSVGGNITCMCGGIPNSPPSIPTIAGPVTGNTGIPTANFTFSNAVDPDGDQVRYVVDWDAGGALELLPSPGYTNSGWSEFQNHTYALGTYDVRVRAEDDNGSLSNWSATHTIVISTPGAAANITSFVDNPDPITLGNTTDLTWTATGNISICRFRDVTNGGLWLQPYGRNDGDTVSPVPLVTPGPVQYELECLSLDGDDNAFTTVTVNPVSSCNWQADSSGLAQGDFTDCPSAVAANGYPSDDFDETDPSDPNYIVCDAAAEAASTNAREYACDDGPGYSQEAWVDYSCSCVALPTTQCSDGVDNSDIEDVLVDAADPGCWTNPLDSGTYDSSDDDETDPAGVACGWDQQFQQFDTGPGACPLPLIQDETDPGYGDYVGFECNEWHEGATADKKVQNDNSGNCDETDFTMTCQCGSPPTATLTVDIANPAFGGVSRLDYSGGNGATVCTAVAWPGSPASPANWGIGANPISGFYAVSNLDASDSGTYTLRCTNEGTGLWDEDSVTITVGAALGCWVPSAGGGSGSCAIGPGDITTNCHKDGNGGRDTAYPGGYIFPEDAVNPVTDPAFGGPRGCTIANTCSLRDRSSCPGDYYTENFTCEPCGALPPAPVPSLLINDSPTPSAVVAGTNVDISWDNTAGGFPDSCQGDGSASSGWNYVVPLADLPVGNDPTQFDTTGLSGPIDFTIDCSNGGGTDSDTVTLTVNAPAALIWDVVPETPILSDTQSTVAWNVQNANTCTFEANGTAIGLTTGAGLDVTGSDNTIDLTDDQTFDLTCTNLAGTPETRSYTIGVLPEDPVLSADPTSVIIGGTTDFSWGPIDGFNVECDGFKVAGEDVGWATPKGVPFSGVPVAPNKAVGGGSETLTFSTLVGGRYRLDCQNEWGAEASNEVVISIVEPDGSISALPQQVLKGRETTLIWQAVSVQAGCNLTQEIYTNGLGEAPDTPPTDEGRLTVPVGTEYDAGVGAGYNSSTLQDDNNYNTGAVEFTTDYTITCDTNDVLNPLARTVRITPFLPGFDEE